MSLDLANINSNPGVRKNMIIKKEELNLFDKFLIEYRKKLFNERELHKANQRLSQIVDEENKKINKFQKRYAKSKKHKYISLFHNITKKQNNLEENKEEEELNNNQRKKMKSHFGEIDSLQDVEKKKMELLYKLKHDLKFKISRGEINTEEMDNFYNFQQNLNKLKEEYEHFNIYTYVRELEEYFSSFEDEILKNQRRKVEEDRINNYLHMINNDFHDKNFMRKLYRERLCKVIDFSEINHINFLNKTMIKEK